MKQKTFCEAESVIKTYL